jgi:hypothetical protein
LTAHDRATIEGSALILEDVLAYKNATTETMLSPVDAPHFAVVSPIPEYLVRIDDPNLAAAARKAGIVPEISPNKSSLTAVEHALELHKVPPRRPTHFLSVSEKFPAGAEGFSGTRIFINRGGRRGARC